MSMFLHQVLEGFEHPNRYGIMGCYNPNRYNAQDLDKYGIVLVGKPYQRNYRLGKEYFVSTEESVDACTPRTAEWATGCLTIGRVTPTMIAGHESFGGTRTSAVAGIVISPAAWEQLKSGDMEKLLPRRLRERNAGNRNLWCALRKGKVNNWLAGEEDSWHADEFTLGEREMYKLSFTTYHFRNNWEWDGTDRPVMDRDWVLAIDRKGWLWCRLFEKGDVLAQWQPNYSGCPFPESDYSAQHEWLEEETKRRHKEWADCFGKSVWVREDDPRFWVKTVGRGEAEK